MDGLLFLASIIAMGLVMAWVRQNDRVGERQATSGLFALRSAAAPRARKDAEQPAARPSSGGPSHRTAARG